MQNYSIQIFFSFYYPIRYYMQPICLSCNISTYLDKFEHFYVELPFNIQYFAHCSWFAQWQ